jgi:hypothetical protein
MVVLLALHHYRSSRSNSQDPTLNGICLFTKGLQCPIYSGDICPLTKGPMPSPTPLRFIFSSISGIKQKNHVLEGSALRPASCWWGPQHVAGGGVALWQALCAKGSNPDRDDRSSVASAMVSNLDRWGLARVKLVWLTSCQCSEYNLLCPVVQCPASVHQFSVSATIIPCDFVPRQTFLGGIRVVDTTLLSWRGICPIRHFFFSVVCSRWPFLLALDLHPTHHLHVWQRILLVLVVAN